MGKAERKMNRVFRKVAHEQFDGQFQLLEKIVQKKPRYPFLFFMLIGAAIVSLFAPRKGWELALSIFIRKETVTEL